MTAPPPPPRVPMQESIAQGSAGKQTRWDLERMTSSSSPGSCLGDFQGPRWRRPGPAALVVGEGIPAQPNGGDGAQKNPPTPGSRDLALDSAFLSPPFITRFFLSIFWAPSLSLSICRMDMTRAPAS